MPARAHLLAVAAAQHVGDVRGAEALADPRHARQDLPRHGHRIGDALELAEAVIARAAVVLVEGLAEIADQPLVAAADAGRIALDVAQQPAARLRQLAVLLEHHAPFQEIRARGDQHALGLEPVPACPSRFLLIVFERLRRAGVDHEADIRSIDAHPERHRRHHQVDLFVQERILIAMAILVSHAGVIRTRPPAGVLQPLGSRVHFLPRRAIDDAGLSAMPLEHVEDLRLERRSRQHAVHQVRPVERADQLGHVTKAKLRDDVAAHARGGRGRVGMQADGRPAIAQACELAVLRTEVVPPLADAMGFVDGDETDRPRRQHVEKTVAAVADQALGGDVEQSIPAVAHAARDLALLFGRQRAVVAGGRHAVADQSVDLILHQRNQRRHDDGEAVAGDGRRLEAEGLAAAGRQHQQRIAARQHRFHRFALQRAERVIAPEFFENFGE